MKWKNLQNNKCPKCFGNLVRDKVEGTHECMDCEDFKISDEKFDELVENMYKKSKDYHVREEEENLSDLNNLGMDEVEDDFSDSPFLDN